MASPYTVDVDVKTRVFGFPLFLMVSSRLKVARMFSSKCFLGLVSPSFASGFAARWKIVSEAFMICPSFLGLFKSSLTMVREGLPSKC